VALAVLTFRGVDNAPHLKKQLMRDIDRQVWRSDQSKPSRVISTARTVS
jgi:hypothetical protein